MYQLNSIIENKVINNLISGFGRSQMQLNNPHESDAEIIQLNDDIKLAVTTDSISEEISGGLYDDPYLAGWMIVTVNLSDLAAVGATPIGILISEIISKDFKQEKIEKLQRGIADACSEYNTFVLGGDTNEGEKLILTGTAIGIIKSGKAVSRIGCNPGDILFSSGKLGSGNAFAISKLIAKNNSFTDYKPSARLEYHSLLKKYASCCMDTSDGLIAALDQLMRLNDTGFELNPEWQKAINNKALNHVKSLNIPSWLLFAGEHGEFELIFTIPEQLKQSFLEDALFNGPEPVELGKVISENEIRIPVYGRSVPVDTKLIRNLPNEVKGDVELYLTKLLAYDFKLKNETPPNFTTH